MTAQSTEVVLKILNGSQLGAEVAIPAGSAWSIGRAEDNNVVITDAAVAPHHAKISLSAAGEVVLEPLDGGCLVDGKPAATAQIRLAPFQIFTMGTTHFAVAPEGAEWPSLRLPVLRTIGVSALKTPPPVKGLPTPAPNPVNRQRLIAAAIVAAVIAIGAIWYFPQMGSGKVSPFQPPTVTANGTPLDSGQTRIEDTLRREIQQAVPTAQMEFSYRAGRPAAKVFLDNENDANVIRRLVNQLPEPVMFSTVVRSQVAISLRVFLQANAIDTLSPEISPPANVAWFGYLKDRAEWANILKMLKADVAGAENDAAGIIFGEDLVKTIEETLTRTGFALLVKGEVTSAGIRLTGDVSPSRQEEWSGVLQQIKTTIGTHTPLLTAITASSQAPGKDPTLSSPIVSVNLEGLPYVQLADGTRLYEGARLPHGFVLESVQPKQVVFNGPQGRRTMEIFQEQTPPEIASASKS